MRTLATTLLSVSLVLLSTPALANVIYQYQGNTFDQIFDEDPPTGTYDTTMSVAGSFELAAPLGADLGFQSISASVLSFSFSDGRRTITESTPGGSLSVFVATDGSGDVAAWSIEVLDAQRAGILMSSAGGSVADEASFAGSGGFDFGLATSPGTWTVVPEPSTAPLLGLGLSVLGLRRRRR